MPDVGFHDPGGRWPLPQPSGAVTSWLDNSIINNKNTGGINSSISKDSPMCIILFVRIVSQHLKIFTIANRQQGPASYAVSDAVQMYKYVIQPKANSKTVLHSICTHQLAASLHDKHPAQPVAKHKL